MKNKSWVTGICLLLFLMGCSGNAADTLETVEDNPVGEEEERGENGLEETENAQFIYEMNEDFIINYRWLATRCDTNCI